MNFFNKLLYSNNLNHLIKKIERNFNTLVYEHDIITKQEKLFNELIPDGGDCELLGYIVLPVDNDCELIITNNPKQDYDLSKIEESFEAYQNIIPVEAIVEFIENEFKGSVVISKVVRFNPSKRTVKTIAHMTEDDNFV